MAKSPDEALATMIDNLPEKTGRSLAEWLQVARQAGKSKHGELVKYLKAEHGVTHGYANLIAHKHLEAQAPAAAEPDLVGSQYAGDKAGLKPIYDALIEAVRGFGSDVEISPKKTYVSLRRSKQFALVQPSTKTRIDVGINLKGMEPRGRLEASGSFNAMVTHRVRVARPADVDQQLIGWLREAYQQA